MSRFRHQQLALNDSRGTISFEIMQELQISKKDLLRLVSRALAIFLASWVFADITYLPVHLYELFHYMSRRSVVLGQDYGAKYSSLTTFFLLFRILVFSLAATWFWRGGGKVESVLSPSADSQ